mmetsp:Transcript_9917/g.18651  ORF Transcript_9917/g.18651 Transcript_9917/m.18651 type:complete len:224 (-) Transcript_9917:200-871(-)|eukprot:CAMPEP_0114244882 /NCGR_PEP_ID=MMETSP0058-20121206/11583_1 /TAXON_ID=36894 /ORGANISM="Pyramimonas parkeae, CCMP726" /LENGTH=223 /DNA_ID=CAMNT_0001357865 /DNA_START=101 /DNA_END=772 /DNA_ORIENTATION=-
MGNAWELDTDALVTEQDKLDIQELLNSLKDEWDTVEEDEDGCKVIIEAVEEGPSYAKGRTVVKAPIAKIMAALYQPGDFLGSMKLLDEEMETKEDVVAKVIEVLDDKHFTSYFNMGAPPVMGISSRDFVCQNACTMLDDKTGIVLSKSIEHPDYPPEEEGFFQTTVRGHRYVSGWEVKDLGDGTCLASSVTRADPKGLIPTMVVNSKMAVVAKFPARLRKHFE